MEDRGRSWKVAEGGRDRTCRNLRSSDAFAHADCRLASRRSSWRAESAADVALELESIDCLMRATQPRFGLRSCSLSVGRKSLDVE